MTFFYIPSKLAEFKIPALEELRDEWINIPNIGYRELICIEEQYFSFLNYVHNNIRYSNIKDRQTGHFPHEFNLFGPPKAGMLFQEIISTAKIIEATLISHGIQRKIINRKVKMTLGKIFQKWLDTKQPELDKFLEETISKIINIRNTLHPDKLHREEKIFYDNLIIDEQKILQNRIELMKLLKNISSD